MSGAIASGFVPISLSQVRQHPRLAIPEPGGTPCLAAATMATATRHWREFGYDRQVPPAPIALRSNKPPRSDDLVRKLHTAKDKYAPRCYE